MNANKLRLITWPTSLLISWLTMFWLNVYLTWPLWSKTNTFPWIPFSEHFVKIPYLIDPLLLIVLLGLHLKLVFAFIRNVGFKILVSLLLSSSVVLVLIGLLNIGRFQPWMWQSVLIPSLTCLQIVLSARQQKIQAFDNRQLILQICQYLTISIYFFSAASKLSESYRHGIGGEFINVIDSILPVRHWCSFILPSDYISDTLLWLIVLSELQIALCLYFRRTRLIGYVWSLLMHLALLVILGPWGAKQEFPVLAWNLYFIIQNTIIICWQKNFMLSRHNSSEEVLHVTRYTPRIPTVKTAVLLVLMLPMLYWFNCYDPWLGWALYSPPIMETTINYLGTTADVHDLSIDDLKNIIGYDFSLQQYSLMLNHAPLLPSKHYQLAVTYDHLSHLSVKGVLTNTEFTDFKLRYALHIQSNQFSQIDNLDQDNSKETLSELEQTFNKSMWNAKARCPK